MLSTVFGFMAGTAVAGVVYLYLAERIEALESGTFTITQKQNILEQKYVPQTSYEQKIINVVKDASPAVVSIVITKDVPIIEQSFIDPFEEFFGERSPFQFQIPQQQQRGTEKKEVGGGSGFIVSADGWLITNNHVVLEKAADYTVFTNDGKSYPAKVLAQDPIQDLAILKIEQDSQLDEKGNAQFRSFPFVKFGNSDALEIGQTVIAIGNALGEFRNTVSVGSISGLGRTITASDGGGFIETIEDVIQTDAAINRGNSGGPLLNLAGEVIGVNTAIVSGAQNIGFAVPSNKAQRDITQFKELGKIVYPFLGIRYTLVTKQLQERKNLPVDYGALIGQRDTGEPAITPGSAAEKAGLKAGDIVLELEGQKITPENSLAKLIQQYNPGDIITLKIMRGGSILNLKATLGERSE